MNKHVNKNKVAKAPANYGDTPVCIAPAIAPEPKVSLRDRILAAQSEEEVNELLNIGATYQHASLNTRGKWERASQIRYADLSESQPVAA